MVSACALIAAYNEAAHVAQVVEGVRRHVFDQLTPSQVETLGTISQKVAQRLADAAAACPTEPA